MKTQQDKKHESAARKGRTQSVGASIAVITAANVVSPVCGAFAMVVEAHVLGVHGRGLVAGGAAPLLLITVSLTLGIPDVISYRFARSGRLDLSLLNWGASITTVVGILGTVVTILSASAISGNDAEIAHLIILSSLAITPTLVLGVYRAAAAGLGRWNRVSAELALGPLIEVAALGLMALVGRLNPVSAVLIIAFAPIAGGVFYRGLVTSVKRQGADERVPVSDPRGAKSIASYAGRVWFGSVFGIMLARLDQVLMVPLSTPTQLGLYAVAVSIAEVPLVVNSAVRTVLFVTESARSDPDSIERFARVSTLCVAVVAVCCDGLVYVGVNVIFGSGFRAAIPSIVILTGAIVVGNPGSAAGAALSARGRPGARSAVLVVAAIINAALIVLLVPPLGADGAAFATLGANIVSGNGVIILLCRSRGYSVWGFIGTRRSDLRIVLAVILRTKAYIRQKIFDRKDTVPSAR